MRIPEGYSQVTLKYISDPLTRGAAVVFGLKNNADESPDDIANDLEGGLLDDWVSNTLSVHALVHEILVKNGPTDDGPTAERIVSIGGDVGGDMVSPNVSLLHSKKTALGGKRHRGRMYTPYTSESVVNADGSITGVHRLAVQEANDDLLSALTVAQLPMVVLHTGVGTPDLVTDLIVSGFAATQRRRLRG